MILKVLKIISILLLPAYLVVTYMYAQDKYDEEVCKDITVKLLNPKEEQYLTENDIKEIITESNLVPTGEKLKNINLKTIENTLQNNPIIKNNECYKTPSGNIVVELEQRTPAYRVITPTETYYIDNDRKKMPVVEKVVSYIPIATGNISDELAQNQLFDFVQYIKEHKKWDEQIEQIVVTENEEIELIPRIGKQLILFGKISNFEKKFNSLDLLYSEIFSKTGWNYYNKINIRYDGKIICTKNKQ